MSTGDSQVLLIEDNRDDVFLMERAVKKSGLPWKLQVVTDGQQALDFFAGVGQFADRHLFPLPKLVFLDLKLPYVSGFEVLTEMHSDPDHKKIPVVILTSSPEERDQQQALELGAKAYLIKPPDRELLRKIAEGDWTTVCNACPVETKLQV